MLHAEFTQKQLDQKYEHLTGNIKVWCSAATDIVGGLAADPKAIRAFVEHHLGITDPAEQDLAVNRILKEEVGERDVTPELGEIREKQVYGVNVVRRSELGPWIASHQIHAGIKQAFSRLGIFTQLRGTKGNFSEAGRVIALGHSLKEANHPERIYVTNSDPKKPAETFFREIMGRVQSPNGAVSIIHHSECIAAGSHFSFQFNFLPDKIDLEMAAEGIAFWTNCGVGSVRSMHYGKCVVDKMTVDLPDAKPKAEKEKQPKVIKSEAKSAAA